MAMESLIVWLVAAAVLYLTAATKGSTRIRDWHEAARAVGLTSVRERGRLGIPSTSLTGALGRLRVKLEKYTRGEHESGTRVTIRLDHGSLALSLRPENLETTFRKVVEGRDVETGDKDFDDELYLQGAAPVVRALLDVETRRVLLTLFRGRVETTGREPIDVRAQLNHGVLQAEVREESLVLASLRSQDLVDVLRGLLAIANRLVAPANIPARIAENLRGEPEVAVRLRLLRTLIEEFPEHPTTRDALLAASADPDAEVRVRAAIALGAEGRHTLLAVAEGDGASDATAAQAVAALADELTFGEAQDILDHALRTRQETTARECLDVLGRSHGRVAIPTLAKALAMEAGALGEAAAQALGATGILAAEPPLLEALGRDAPKVRIAAVRALGRVGGVTAVPKLREAAERRAGDGDLSRAARHAVAEIQSRLATAMGARPGQLSLAGGEAGQVSLVEDHAAGRLTLADSDAVAGNSASEDGAPTRTPPAVRPRTSE